MQTDRQRILELALESLERKKKQIEEEIAALQSEIKGKPVSKKPAVKTAKKVAKKPAVKTAVKTANKVAKKAAPAKASSKRIRFTKEERLRRSQRMKEYWENWRKKNPSSK